MAHRRSGAKRRSMAARQNAQEQSWEEQYAQDRSWQDQSWQDQSWQEQSWPEQATDSKDNVTETVPVERKGRSGRGGGRNTKSSPLKPAASEVVAAVASLYLDQLKPFGRILRKRIAERHAAGVTAPTPVPGLELPVGEAAVLPDVNVAHLRAVCEECATLKLEPEEGGDWSVTLSGCPASFVDIYDPVDVYPEEMWAAAAEYFENAPHEETTLPGGRYSCARTLLSRGLRFLANRSLGQVCHIVQLAITDRKVLGYLNGSVVSYQRSQSMVKEQCASQQAACANMCAEAASLDFATWESARSCLRTILAEAADASDTQGPGVVPLSNIKRTFRTQFQLELSETRLGHSKLSELLQDHHFKDVCKVELEKHGYSVVQAGPSKSPTTKCRSPKEQHEFAHAKFCQDDPLCLEDADVPMEVPDLTFGPTPVCFGPTPVPSPEQTNRQDEPSFLSQLLPLYLQDVQHCGVDMVDTCCRQFCPGEPLSLEDVGDMMSAPNYFGPAPYQAGLSFMPGLAMWDDLVLNSSMMQHETGTAGLNMSSCDMGSLPVLAEQAQDVIKSQFCSDDPLQLADADIELTSKDKQDVRHAQPRWPSLSPWKDGKLNRMVRNTFIHSSIPPPTPVVGSLRRSSSLGHMQRQGQGSDIPSGSPKARVVISLSDHITES